ncbi:phosphatase PAP2 family protein [Streptomyces sp. HUAS MG47]|uniref:phosphatase PAP2 family protein n=1 Tax=Streptomyces solicamelliae TaxID=3231716 RepID=UPI003878283C
MADEKPKPTGRDDAGRDVRGASAGDGGVPGGDAAAERLSPGAALNAVLGDLDAIDGALYAAVAATPTPTLDRALRRLSHTADHSKISLTVAAAMALMPGRPRQAAVAGVGAIMIASAAANLLGKRMVRRRRPDREAARVVVDRHVPMPKSASFPSGHTASATAFATAVGVVLPPAAVPLGILASAVGYSRVHTGVHYPGDVAAGAVLGLSSAVAALALTYRPRHHPPAVSADR